MSNKKTWDPRFGLSYTPEEMLKMGVFEGKYINAIEGIPASWKKLPKVLGPDDEPDEKLNYFGVKSRQPLSVWKQNKWIKTDKWGWYHWYIEYYLGRRLGEEDTWQINRWRSFVARHQGQISAKCDLKNDKCNTRQRQGLLQWGWNSYEKYSEDKVLANAKIMAKDVGLELEEKTVATESIHIPQWSHW
jgi:hypothetical protein